MRRFSRLLRAVGLLAAAACLAACASTSAPADDPACELQFRVVPRYDTVPRRLDVSLTFPAQGRAETYLRVQEGWAGVDDFAAALGHWRGADAAVTVEPAALPQRLRVSHPRGGRVRIDYEAKASLSDPDDGKPQDHLQQYRTQIGADWFRFFGYGVLPSVEPWGDARRDVAMCVTVAQPGLAEAPVFGSHFADRGSEVTRRFDGSPSLLRHAFYGGGPGWRRLDREIAGGTLHLAFRGRYGAADAEFADRAAALVETQRRFWGDARSDPQWIVVNPNFTPYDTGGTVVHRAAVLFANQTFVPSSDSFQTLIGHENLHGWIPQRLGAHSGDPSDYWLSEGFTDYYTHRLLLASGVWSLPQYAQALTQQLRTYRLSPARNAGARSIAGRFFSDADAGRQMYSRGELLALRWDQALRDRGLPGLDDVIRATLLPAGSDAQAGPPAHERVLDALAPALGTMARDDVARFIGAGDELPLAPDLLGPCFAVRWVEVPRWVRGFDMASLQAFKAIGVAVDGPAYRAGLREGMRLVGWSIFGNDTDRDLSLTVLVDGERKTLAYRPVDGSLDRLPLVEVAADAAAADACQRWIRRPSPPRPAS